MALADATHTAEHPQRDWLAIKRAGLWLFFLSESVVVGLLLAARFFISGTDREHLDQELGLAITVLLLASSMSAFAAEAGIAKDNRKLFMWGTALTIFMGLVFAGGVAYEWTIAEFGPSNPFGTVFFAMTGVHAAHVLSGVFMLILVLLAGAKGKYSAKDHWPVSAVVMYWHFVDVVWVFFYPALYLVG